MISNLLFSSGGVTYRTRSNLPVRNNELSMMSGLFVIPMTATRDEVPSSISVNSWLSMVSPDPPSPDFDFASASNSSKIITHGDYAFAFLKISLIAFSDSPTHFERISGPLTKIIFAPVSVATALASNVFPHPGGP